MIIKEAIGVGDTIDAAREDALSKLDAAIDDDVKFDTLALPRKKTLGLFGGSEAKIKAYIEGPDAPIKPAKPEKPAKPAKAEKPVKNTVRKPDEAKPAEKAEHRAEPKAVNAETAETKEAPVGVPAESVDPASQAGKAYAYLKSVLEKLGCSDITATISEVEGGSKITLEGSDKLGVIIGRRGETLDALQYLASLVANEKGSGYYRVVIDIGNYREKREGTLESLAKRTANQVLRTGRSRTLEPMNPYERRIIHTAVQEIEGVSSSSVGDGMGRRVVISPEGKTPRPSQSRGRDRRQGDRPGFRTERKAPTTETAETTAAAAPSKSKETDGTKLYGKLG